MKTQELVEKRLKKYSVNQLTSKLEKGSANETEVEVIVSILEKRGQDVSKWRMASDDTNVEETIDQSTEESLELQNLKDEVDVFVDSLISSRRDGVYTEVMKILGGTFESDLDELLENATIAQLKEALSFKKIKEEALKKVSKRTPTVKKEKTKEINTKKSTEVENISVGSTVEFEDKDGKKLCGEILNIFASHKNGKEICRIKLSSNKIVHKRTNKLILTK